MAKVHITKAKITRAAQALKDAEMPVERVDITPDGHVIFYMFGAVQPVEEINDWDKP